MLARIMRLLVGMGVFKEQGKGLYSSTNLAGAYVTGSTLAAGLTHVFVSQASLL